MKGIDGVYPPVTMAEWILMLAQPPKELMSSILRPARRECWSSVRSALERGGYHLDPPAWTGSIADMRMQAIGEPLHYKTWYPMLFRSRLWRLDGLSVHPSELRGVMELVESQWLPALSSRLQTGIALLNPTEVRRYSMVVDQVPDVRSFYAVHRGLELWRQLVLERDADHPDPLLSEAYEVLARLGRDPFDDTLAVGLPALINALPKTSVYQQQAVEAWKDFETNHQDTPFDPFSIEALEQALFPMSMPDPPPSVIMSEEQGPKQRIGVFGFLSRFKF